MLREIGHFFAHVPAVLRRKRALSQAELFDELTEAADQAGMAAWRSQLVGELSGDIVEIGYGTGRMFPHYGPGARVRAVEPSEDFAALAGERARNSRASIECQSGTGEALPFGDSSADAVVIAMVLCSVPRVDAVLSEVRRVLRPGGAVHLIEHVVSDRVVAAACMHLVNPLWRLANGQGCNLNRSPVSALRASGFDVLEEVPFQVFAAGLPAFPMRLIRAKPGSGSNAATV